MDNNPLEAEYVVLLEVSDWKLVVEEISDNADPHLYKGLNFEVADQSDE